MHAILQRRRATVGAASLGYKVLFVELLQTLNRHDRTWNRSSRVTAVLPHNSYYVSLNGSRRVTQRTRAHIKSISLFPILAEDVCFGRQPLRVASEAPHPRAQPGVVPVAAMDCPGEKTEALNPAAVTEDADEVEDVHEVKCPIDDPAPCVRSSSPVLRCRCGTTPSSSASQPAQRPQEPLPVAPPISRQQHQ